MMLGDIILKYFCTLLSFLSLVQSPKKEAFIHLFVCLLISLQYYELGPEPQSLSVPGKFSSAELSL